VEVTKKENILGTENIYKLLKMFSIPAMASMIANALYNIIDQIFIGHAIGYLGNAATTVAFPITTIALAIGTLLGVGGSAFAAIKLGEGNNELAEKTLTMVSSWLFVIGIIIGVLGLVFLEPIMTVFGASSETMLYSKQFSSVFFSIMPVSLVLICLANMARTDGSPKVAMNSLLFGVVVNIIFAPIFLFVFKWGMIGAGLATALAQISSVIILIEYFLHSSRMRFKKKYLFACDFNSLKRLSAIGLSSFVTQTSGMIVQILLNNSIMYYGDLSKYGGDVALSAIGIVMKLNMIFIAICIGIGIGSQPIVGFNRGAQKWDRVKKTYVTALKAATIVTFIGWSCCEFIPSIMLSAFGANGENFMEFGVLSLRIFMFFVFTAGFQINTVIYFQSTGQPFKATILSSLRLLVLLVPLILILPLKFGLMGILYAGAVADLGSATVIAIFAYRELKILDKNIAKMDHITES
jgi:putative MATE family efflux protein